MGASSFAREGEAHRLSEALDRRPPEGWRWLRIFLNMFGFSQRGTDWRRYYTGIGSFYTQRWNSAEETTQVQWSHRRRRLFGMAPKLERMAGNVLRLETLSTENVAKLEQKGVNIGADEIEARGSKNWSST